LSPISFTDLAYFNGDIFITSQKAFRKLDVGYLSSFDFFIQGFSILEIIPLLALVFLLMLAAVLVEIWVWLPVLDQEG